MGRNYTLIQTGELYRAPPWTIKRIKDRKRYKLVVSFDGTHLRPGQTVEFYSGGEVKAVG